MRFEVTVLKGTKNLWVCLLNDDGNVKDMLKLSRFSWFLERRINRKIRRLIRMHEKLVSLGYRKD